MFWKNDKGLKRLGVIFRAGWIYPASAGNFGSCHRIPLLRSCGASQDGALNPASSCALQYLAPHPAKLEERSRTAHAQRSSPHPSDSLRAKLRQHAVQRVDWVIHRLRAIGDESAKERRSWPYSSPPLPAAAISSSPARKRLRSAEVKSST